MHKQFALTPQSALPPDVELCNKRGESIQDLVNRALSLQQQQPCAEATAAAGATGENSEDEWRRRLNEENSDAEVQHRWADTAIKQMLSRTAGPRRLPCLLLPPPAPLTPAL